MRDLLTHGGFVGNQDLAKILVDESRDRVIEMQGLGRRPCQKRRRQRGAPPRGSPFDDQELQVQVLSDE